MKLAILLESHQMMSFLEAKQEMKEVEINLAIIDRLSDPVFRKEYLAYLAEQADLIFLIPSTHGVWEEISMQLKIIGQHKPMLSTSHRPEFSIFTTVNEKFPAIVQAYLTIGGKENVKNALYFLLKEILGAKVQVDAPQAVAWQGIYVSQKAIVLENLAAYLTNPTLYQEERKTIGILFSRSMWLNHDTGIVDALIKEIHASGYNALPVFSVDRHDPKNGRQDNISIIENYFMKNKQPLIEALIDLQVLFLISRNREGKIEEHPGYTLLQELNVPIFKGVIINSQTEGEWRKNPFGIPTTSIVTSITMPECSGVIEPIVIGALKEATQADWDEIPSHVPILERIQFLCRRIKKWMALREKNNGEKKIVFILHNSVCHGVELTVGAANGLNALESLVQLMKKMKLAGYQVDSIPDSGEKLIELIMQRKAISDFRWTPVEEIVKKGGVWKSISLDEYLSWFNRFPKSVQEAMKETWGNPPGEEQEEVPPAMVYDQKILVTGVQFGNVLVCVQPKRGCAGARCDGKVCKILHNPLCPPTHQYVATYRCFEELWGADAVVHVGTHGSLEFLPGKSIGLTESCYPEITLGTMPNLYIYNTDNPAEGAIAKRKSYATLIGHMQMMMQNVAPYGAMEKLAVLLNDYARLNHEQKCRADTFKQKILSLAIAEKYLAEEKNEKDEERIICQLHQKIVRLKQRMCPKGMHTLGKPPEDKEKMEYIRMVLDYDGGAAGNLSRLIAEIIGLDYDELLEKPYSYSQTFAKTYDELLDAIAGYEKEFIAMFAQGNEQSELVARFILGEKIKSYEKISKLDCWQQRIKKMSLDIAASDEIQGILQGLTGGYLPTGPAGLIIRGRSNVLPTGRNFYSADPTGIPTKAAWKTGQNLAEGLILRYQKESGRYPENCAIVLWASDCMWSDGEVVAQILALLGVVPKWNESGEIQGFTVQPIDELKRPRIDVTLRISGVLRDAYPNIPEYLNEVIQTVARLPEPIQENFVRKHTLENLAEDTPESWEIAATRIFGGQENTYGTGINLAILASAWQNEQDLADVFLTWSAHLYGSNGSAKTSLQQLKKQLATVDLVYNKSSNDAHDLLGSASHFSYMGGLATTAKLLQKNREIKTYYGDTRNERKIRITSLAEEIAETVQTRLCNPQWIAGMKENGYKGAGEIAKRIANVYGWDATSGAVGDWIFDAIAQTYIMDKAMQMWFKEHNPWAMEDINRRMLEAVQRNLWKPENEVLEALKRSHLEVEGWMEESVGEIDGDFQGSAVNLYTPADVPAWKARLLK